MLYPLSYGGAPGGDGIIPPILSSPPSISGRTNRPGRSWPGVCRTPSPDLLRRDRTSVPRSGSGLPGPPALLPWSPRLRAAVSGTHPHLPGELSPLPAFRLTGLLSVAAVVTRPCGQRALTYGFVRPTFTWQLGSSSGRNQRRITHRLIEKVPSNFLRLQFPCPVLATGTCDRCLRTKHEKCGRGDSNSHPV